MKFSRRSFVYAFSSLLGLSAARAMALPGSSGFQRTSLAHPDVAEGPFSLTELPYGYNDLEPYIDGLTMEIHHRRHHGGQVSNLNRAVERFPELNQLSIEAVMKNVSEFDTAVRNNGGGHYNHDLFWKVMAPPGKGGEISPSLSSALTRHFGSEQAFREAFTAAANGQFGSGWAWLIIRDDGSLAVTSTPNQDNPLMDVVEERGQPILGIDVWEHAHYLAYQNRRAAYVRNWWKLVNWTEVSRRYEAGLA